jgi:hypothetical protein
VLRLDIRARASGRTRPSVWSRRRARSCSLWCVGVWVCGFGGVLWSWVAGNEPVCRMRALPVTCWNRLVTAASALPIALSYLIHIITTATASNTHTKQQGCRRCRRPAA